ncbi:MAG: DEAD/DEAH box helicase [Acidimicrobiales bacterium]
MIVVHAWWQPPAGSAEAPEGRLVLWAEDSTAPAVPPRRSGRRPKVQDHPFAVRSDDLAKVLDLATSAGAPGEAGTGVLELPTRGAGPVPSPELPVVGQGAASQPAAGRMWRVPTLALDPDAALVLLSTGSDRSGGGTVAGGTETAWAEQGGMDGVGELSSDPPLLGAGMRHLQALAAFANDLAARGRVLPAVLPATPGHAAAVWKPLVTGADAVWLRSVLAGMPASAWAAVAANQADFGQAGDVVAGAVSAAAEALATAVDDLTDAAVRRRLVAPPGRRSGTARPAAALPGPRARRGSRSRPAARWRDGLRGSDRLFEATSDEVTALDKALSEWQREVTDGGTVRACFRLVEPPDVEPPDADARDAGPPDDRPLDDRPPDDRGSSAPGEEGGGLWRLEFGLQAADEPSLVVDAALVWKSGRGLRALARHVTGPQETLLAELGRAVRLYPALEGALRTARPSELALDTAAAHDFLSEAAPMLVASGFGVLLPGWWTNPSARLGARLHVSTPSQPGATGRKPVIGQEGLADFQWQLAVGDQALSDEEIADLVGAQQPLVRLRGQWVQVDPDRLARATAFLSRKARRGTARMTVAEVLHALGSGDDGPGGLPVVSVKADGWLEDLLAPGTEHRVEPVPAPAAFAGTLRPYQQRGLAWLSFLESVGLGGVLADDMGLGKTIQLLALVARDAELAGPSGAARRPTLLVCPMSLVGNWQREAARFTPQMRVHVHHGAERPRGEDFDAAVASSDLVVTTYALLVRDSAALRKVAWARVVLDEAQAVKNAATKAAVAARSLPARRRVAVTGTPVENRLADLWSLMEFANPQLLGTAAQFKERFAIPIEKHGDEDAGRRLRAMTQPFVLRRLKTDSSIISDLPEKMEMEVVCSLTSEQASLYQAVVTEMLERIATTAGIERRGLVLATMTKLKQVCNHPAQFLKDGSRLGARSGKLARLEETLDEVLAMGEKALLFTQYAEFGHMLRAHLVARYGREVAYLHGGVVKAERDTMVARFQDGGSAGPSLFVLSLKAGGTGLNLTAANHVVHIDRWWNPAVEDQATDRAFRIGQTRSVQVRKFVCAGTLEEKISSMIRDKRGLAARIVGSGEGWLTEMSTSDLRALFSLDAGAVE